MPCLKATKATPDEGKSGIEGRDVKKDTARGSLEIWAVNHGVRGGVAAADADGLATEPGCCVGVLADEPDGAADALADVAGDVVADLTGDAAGVAVPLRNNSRRTLLPPTLLRA